MKPTFLMIVALAASCHFTPAPVVSAGSGAASCEVAALEQVVTSDGVSIVLDIFDAVMSGGSSLPKLISDLIAEFGPSTVQCAAELVAELSAAVSPVSTGSGSGESLSLPAARSGREVLLSEMDHRGWPHGM